MKGCFCIQRSGFGFKKSEYLFFEKWKNRREFRSENRPLWRARVEQCERVGRVGENPRFKSSLRRWQNPPPRRCAAAPPILDCASMWCGGKCSRAPPEGLEMRRTTAATQTLTDRSHLSVVLPPQRCWMPVGFLWGKYDWFGIVA